MRFSVFTASTPEWTPEEAAQYLAEQGWDGIEWRITDQQEADEPGFWSGNRATWPLSGLEERLDDIARITRESGLEFSGIGGYARCDQHDDVERMLAATARLGARQVRVTMPRTDSGDYRALFAAARRDIEWAAERAAHHGVKALVELHHETITPSASAAFRLLDGLDPEHVGVIHDLGNLVIEGREETLASLQLLGPYLAHVHVKNAAWVPGEPETDGTVHWHHEWAPLRSGTGDVDAYFRALHAFGYDGWVTCEDFSTAVPLAERTRDDLAYLRAVDARTRPTAVA
ncbi:MULTISPECIES: sugar phosphate isomerase/epimerase family protein [unclassified Leifsonia]|uniref:sugar phosphate isomerase/epimerase family protein n=1 Tax=unclassified Leifsonia TaxID=2663824 RepID=UPI00037486FF|nr:MULTISPECIES: sugar phosphate isomerase/epimerase family protein [unclassified Leifsonia]TDP99482.1 sugar phosphate isomerase/epimerase [Leifsonia sp. 115AMFTsu3.1]